MIKNFSIQIKAAFLLTVFTMNTVVGFACSIGLNMGFNSNHHPDEKGKEAVIHVHANGNKHVHQKETSTNSRNKSHHNNKIATETVVHDHANGKKHSHQEKPSNHRPDKFQPQDEVKNDHQSKDEKGNCCTDKVMEFEQLDKSVARSLTTLNPIFFTVFVSTFYNIDVSFLSQGAPNIKYFVRSHHPPIPDIRIAIQSFQI